MLAGVLEIDIIHEDTVRSKRRKLFFLAKTDVSINLRSQNKMQ